MQLRVQDCPGFNGFVYDAYTGFNSVSRILVEEVLPCEWGEGASVWVGWVVGRVLAMGVVG